ncbi:MAG: tRNA pseudouridine(38-40) synthase TruA [Planctomycetes bacterium]|jgi:tRNA pseudouridine38-40 synthase|nr:tRNA pseudouridine(38-40) synthase TruA [Planctomycetota bacterium]
MLRTLRLTIEYDGTDFSGWQRQRGDRSVQEVLEDALSRHLCERITIIGAGRTDAGVHAAGQVASFRTGNGMPARGVWHGTNALLPGDVAILGVEEAEPDFHARRDATGKHYRYSILERPVRSPLHERRAFRVPAILDAAMMTDAARRLLGCHDFSSFRNAGSFEGSAVRTLSRLDVSREGAFLHLDVAGDGFLYRMVRNIAGTLIRVGERRLAPEEVGEILERRERPAAGPAAPARGLCLVEVFYEPAGRLSG